MRFFAENLLEDTAGSCFVLEALERRTLPADPGGVVADVLSRAAQAAFADVLVVDRAGHRPATDLLGGSFR